MKQNVTLLDSAFRIVLGLVVLSLVFWGPQSNWGYLGLIPLISGLLSFFPLYGFYRFFTSPFD